MNALAPTSPTVRVNEPRITKRIERAIHHIVHDGRTTDEAAQLADMKPESLRKALKKPHVAAFRRAMMAAYLDCEAERSVSVMVKLRDTAGSEHVRAEMAKHLAALGGIRPPEREGVNVNINVTPGYVIDLSDAKPDGPPVLDGTAVRVLDGQSGQSGPQDVVAE